MIARERGVLQHGHGNSVATGELLCYRLRELENAMSIWLLWAGGSCLAALLLADLAGASMAGEASGPSEFR